MTTRRRNAKPAVPAVPVQMHVYVPADMKKRLRLHAAKTDRTASSIVTEALDLFLRKAGA